MDKTNPIFKGIANTGKSTMGWFYGLKLHLLINNKGQLIAVKITPGNTDDRRVLPLAPVRQNLAKLGFFWLKFAS